MLSPLPGDLLGVNHYITVTLPLHPHSQVIYSESITARIDDEVDDPEAIEEAPRREERREDRRLVAGGAKVRRRVAAMMESGSCC